MNLLLYFVWYKIDNYSLSLLENDCEGSTYSQRKMLIMATCVFSDAFKKWILVLMHKGCVLQHISFGALSGYKCSQDETKYR